MLRDTGDWHLRGHRNFSVVIHQNFHDFLDLAEPDPLILGGDTLEDWADWWWEIWNGPNRDIINRINDRKQETIVIKGNHDGEDEILRRFFPRANVLDSLKIANRLIIHAHQFDPLLDEWQERWIARNFDRAFTLIDLPFLNALREKIADKDRDNRFLIDSLIRIRENGDEYLTHHSHAETDDGWYVNPGSPIRPPFRFPYVEVDEHTGNCALKYLKEAA